MAVTVRAAAQSVGVNRRSVWSPGAGSTSTVTAGFRLLTATVTRPVGWVASRTVYACRWAAAISSSARARGAASSAAGVAKLSRVRARVSASATVTATPGRAAGGRFAYSAPAASCVMVRVSFVALSSAAAVTVTDRGTAQSSGVNRSTDWTPGADGSASAVTGGTAPRRVTTTSSPGCVARATV